MNVREKKMATFKKFLNKFRFDYDPELGTQVITFEKPSDLFESVWDAAEAAYMKGEK